jgi:hypothetical protein
MTPQFFTARNVTRREFLGRTSLGLGALALSQFPPPSLAKPVIRPGGAAPLSTMAPHFPGKAKRVIYIHLAGAPSQHELYDYKPELAKVNDQPCPQSFLDGKRFAFIKGVPKMLGPQFPFAQHGQSGLWLSDRLPHLAQQADKLCLVKSMFTDQFNHAPAQLFVQTGMARVGRPGFGTWVTYGLGTENQDLPGFVVLLSGGKNPDGGKALWSSGFMPSVYQGVQCRAKGEPILYVQNPDGLSREMRRRALDSLAELNRAEYASANDPETLTRIEQYELAYRMQMSVPEATDITKEPEEIHALYGTTPGKESLANNCLLARRLIERGVRFVQLYDWGWDAHGATAEEALNKGFVEKCKNMDQPVAALLGDLEKRGLLADTLVVCGGEFGRTPMQENRGGNTNPFTGRDHNPGAFTIWMAGGGTKAGLTYGETDEFGYQGVVDRVGVHDLQATILHLLGFDHERLTFPFQGRDYRLTDVEGHVVKALLA